MSNWVNVYTPNPAASLRVLCFPFAGGSASLYRSWSEGIGREVEVCGIQLPGRETRLRETPFSHLTPLVEALRHALAPYLDRPFALLGHSNGALIAFELARQLQSVGAPGPKHLVVAGRRAPHILGNRRPVHALDDDDLIADLRSLNGTPAEVLQNRELLSLVMPALRADFAVDETYRYLPSAPLACPITAIGGKDDGDVSSADLLAWKDHTTGAFRVATVPGDHFFILRPSRVLFDTVAEALGVPSHS